MSLRLNNARILITGAGGYLGRQLVARLASRPDGQRPAMILAHDSAIARYAVRRRGVPGLRHPLTRCGPSHRPARHYGGGAPGGHHAPARAHTRDFEHDVDVNGTRLLLRPVCAMACSASSSPAAARPMATTRTTPLVDGRHARARQRSLRLSRTTSAWWKSCWRATA